MKEKWESARSPHAFLSNAVFYSRAWGNSKWTREGKNSSGAKVKVMSLYTNFGLSQSEYFAYKLNSVLVFALDTRQTYIKIIEILVNHSN